jgi:hypothetical protein
MPRVTFKRHSLKRVLPTEHKQFNSENAFSIAEENDNKRRAFAEELDEHYPVRSRKGLQGPAVRAAKKHELFGGLRFCRYKSRYKSHKRSQNRFR